MALVYQQNINENTRLGIWEIEEDEALFTDKLKMEVPIRHPHKRLQHLAGRYLLCTLFPDFPMSKISFLPGKKPFLPDYSYQFTISHCGKFAAAMVSKDKKVGIDIEVTNPKVERIAHKFCTEEEKLLQEKTGLAALDFYTLIWSTKEALFKWYALGEVDFKKDMTILNIEHAPPHYSIQCFFGKEVQQEVTAKAIFFEGHVLVWICD